MNSFWTFWFWKPSCGSKFHSWVARKQQKVLFHTVLASFCFGFWCYLAFVLWETLHKHFLCTFSSPFMIPYALSMSTLSWFYSSLQWTILFNLHIWSLVILIALLCTISSSALPWNTRVWKEESMHGKRRHEDLNYKSSLSSIRLYWRGFKGKGNYK